MGDFNARIPQLEQFNSDGVIYSANPDTRSNRHGNEMINLCQSAGIRPINHRATQVIQYDGGFTLYKDNTGISQIDWCFCSIVIIPRITAFSVKPMTQLSDHTPIELNINIPQASMALIYEQAKNLNAYPERAHKTCRSPVLYINITPESFTHFLPNGETLKIGNDASVDDTAEMLSNVLYQTCKKAIFRRKSKKGQGSEPDRWKWISKYADSKTLWNAINWKGTFSQSSANNPPSDLDFKQHFEELLNTETSPVLAPPASNVYVPILDDDISPLEVQHQVNKLKVNKAAGTDGLPPGVLKHLTPEWIITLTVFFNLVFSSGHYPTQWLTTKFFTIFKKGKYGDTNNYRGISILPALAKIYDAILNHRLQLWFTPDVEQAGAQKGRSCTEQILTLRLIKDIAYKCKNELFVLFVDFQKAYDKVPRTKLLQLLSELGCGQRMLCAITASLQSSKSTLNSVTFNTSVGVRQGGSTSCSLFTIFTNPLIRAIKRCESDGFLQNLHMLMFMDDTVILSTTREGLVRKIRILLDYCQEYSMMINPTKTKFIAMNTQQYQPIEIGGHMFNRCSTYEYLGAIISERNINEELKLHAKAKQRHVRKYNSFLARNPDAPFHIKKTVWNAALKSALLYGCETWWANSLKCVETSYMATIKALLGVRVQTCTELCLIEAGASSLKAHVLQTQKNFIQQIKSKTFFEYSPLKQALELAKTFNSPMHIYSTRFGDGDYDTAGNEILRNKIITSTSSRRVNYLVMNPTLNTHPVYSEHHAIPDHLRIAFTRLRLSSHRLKIETGRWARIEKENRTCSCNGGVQDELHVLCNCRLTIDIRERFSHLRPHSVNEIMSSVNILDICRYCYAILRYFEKL